MPNTDEALKALTLVPSDTGVTLEDCPPGPFFFNGSLGFKTEYRAMETVGPVNVPVIRSDGELDPGWTPIALKVASTFGVAQAGTKIVRS